MSLIAKIQQQSLLQNKLQAQLAEMSYQAVNGTRQAPRNFREGTLEIGKMHFTTPQDRITKEMIMDYQQAQQEKHSNQTDSAGNPLLYEPTGLSDALDVYKPIDYAPLGKVATEDDVRTYEAGLLQLHYELDALKEKYKNKNKEYLDKLEEHNVKVREINDTLQQLKTAKQNFINLKKELKETNNNILAHNASLPSGATPSNKFTKKLDYLDAKEKRLQKDVTDADLLATITIPDKLLVLKTELVPLAADYPILKTERDNIQKVEIVQKENEIPKKETEIRQIKQNIIENKEAIQIVNNTNKDITRKYTDTFNMANRDRYSVQQDPNEGDQEYINRIKLIEKNTYDPNIFQEKAFNEGNLKLMSNLRNSLRDEVKISEIVKAFNAEEVFIINTNWDKIQEQLEIKFGINNPNKTVNSYVAEIRDIVDKLQNKQYGTILSAVSTASTKLASATAPTTGVYDIPHTDSTTSDFVINVENNSLYIGNKKRKKAIWVKIGHLNRDFIMFSNTTNIEKEFRAFKYTLTGNYSFKKIMEILGLNLDDDIRVQLFGPYGHGFVAKDMFNFLKATHKLSPETGKKFEEDHETMYGWGLNKEAITKHAKFGKNIILLDKLAYKNILSIKDKKMHSVEHLPNVKVSDTLADIIINMCKNEYPSKQTLDTLSSSEKQLFDLLLYVSGLRKSKHVNKTENTSAKDANIKELKQRFKIVEAEIQAGNNNPIVKAELKEIINKLVLYNVISQNNGKKYLQQY